jgi:hypothetical protein
MFKAVGKPDSSHQQQKAHQPEPSSYVCQQKVPRKPSLKWKFCHAVASVVTTHDSNARNTVDNLIELENNKPEEVPALRASSANSRKKKKCKSTVRHKKLRCVSSASSGKHTYSKKLVKT